MRHFFKNIFNHIIITGLIVALQITFIVIELSKFTNQAWYISTTLHALSIIVVFFIIYKNSNPAVKLAWIVPILLFPIFGGFLYLVFGHLFIPRILKRNIVNSNAILSENIEQDMAILDSLAEKDYSVYSQCKYISKFGDAPVWCNTLTHYFSDGEEYLSALLEDLDKAKKYIFIEYFIISQGYMWTQILEVLKRKVEEGLEVRIIYDDFGSTTVLPPKYYLQLEKIGIKCICFNRIFPLFSMIMNNRDHRKIVVIDGQIGYTGGINIADEYINRKERFGYWKDAGLRLEGDAVTNMVILFLQIWAISKGTDFDPKPYLSKNIDINNSSYIQPYGDSPLDEEAVAENVYLNIINNSKKYLWIYTPYLIMDNVMMESLKLACKRGVDVRIVTPGIPDKKMVFYMTRCSYKPLMEAGAKLYEYTPGFIHAKCTLCDDSIVDIGTVNYDYRSLYHHFECGVLMYNSSIVDDLKKDMENSFEVSEEITEDFLYKRRFNINVAGPILHLFAPLL